MKKATFLMVIIATLLGMWFGVHKVEAATGPFNRDFNTGYFTGQNKIQGDWAFVPTTNVNYDGLGVGCKTNSCTVTVTSFIQTYHDRLKDFSSFMDRGRAAAEIDMMLGQNGTNFGGSIQNGIDYANAHWTQWVNLVNLYAGGSSPGYSVQWNASVDFVALGVTTNGLGMMNNPDTSIDLTTCTAADKCIGDMTFSNTFMDTAVDDAVVFHYPGGAFYIKHKCANLTGDLRGLPKPPPLVPTCDSASAVQEIIDPYSLFNVTATIDFPSSASATAAYKNGDQITIRVQGPNPANTFNYGPVANTPQNPNGAASLTATSGNIGPTNSTGLFNITYALVDGSGSTLLSCPPQQFTIAHDPYFVVYSGDILSGAGMTVTSNTGATVCTSPDRHGSIVGWNNESPGYNGAGTQQAAFALNYIEDFATARQTGSLLPSGLSFANTTNVTPPGPGTGQDTYGGGLKSENCMPDYFDTHPTTADQNGGTMTITSNAQIAAANKTKTIYINNGNLVIDTPLNTPLGIPNGSHTTIYVDGNVQIDDDIDFSDVYNNGRIDIPSFTIIASGNIYIANSANNLDGFYIAEPNFNAAGTEQNGLFYTCSGAGNFVAPTLDHTLYGNCNSQLFVNGAVIAKQVWLTRTSGDVELNRPAERFTADPESWLSLSPTSPTAGPYDAITGLPPNL